MTKTKFISFFLLLLWITSCKEQKKKNISKTEEINRTDLAQLELKDSSSLTKVKAQFYKSKSGQLFERTFADREIQGVDTLVSVEYFNGNLPQDIDPLTFEQLDGWFAKDKSFAYYYRPTSGGMLCVKLDSADSKTFHLIPGQYLYAVDNKHVFKEAEILENIDPQKMIITKDKEGKILKIQSGFITYTAD
ncbi:DKNYY domain-containing protein [Ferruginibacter albus]|uniref:DKNYY domain-containing protein n=1 Tax=Ferruginibacter albus TaxID=2875540 RepID=UPI001CC5EAD8|nr:DKNYY domain-containing protein [Ferruginibacter albus]UAY51043.1 DKNYY domain-containing protein [Ferruginibacter albus]